MFNLTKDQMTCWTSDGGYGRRSPSEAWCTFINDASRSSDDGFRAAGYSLHKSSEDHAVYDVILYEHETTGELIVLLDSVDVQWLAGVSVEGQHADAFMFTEFLRLTEQLGRINNLEPQRIAHKAHLAFIRHGHGTSTISETGTTKEDLDLMRANQRLREQRRRQESPRSGS